MKLSLVERFVLLSALPREGDFATLRVLTNLRLALAPTEEEIAQWEIASDPAANRTTWKVNGEADIPIGEKATDIIVGRLKGLDREKRLPLEALSVYEKFIPDN
jgi:hypothetical protein